jgi:F-box/leucine-rich repeat protein 10/11
MRRYCKSCIDLSNDPTNPNRPHHPLITTTKPNFPPRQPKRKSVGLVRASSTSSHGTSAAPAKRAKLETAEDASKGESADDSSAPSRPKRQAALNRPDYHALHHHIATPTGKWLRLIADPEKYNATILDGKLRLAPDKLTLRRLSQNSR